MHTSIERARWARRLEFSTHRPVMRALLLGLAVSVGITLLSRVGYYAGWERWAVDSFLFSIANRAAGSMRS